MINIGSNYSGGYSTTSADVPPVGGVDSALGSLKALLAQESFDRSKRLRDLRNQNYYALHPRDRAPGGSANSGVVTTPSTEENLKSSMDLVTADEKRKQAIFQTDAMQKQLATPKVRGYMKWMQIPGGAGGWIQTSESDPQGVPLHEGETVPLARQA